MHDPYVILKAVRDSKNFFENYRDRTATRVYLSTHQEKILLKHFAELDYHFADALNRKLSPPASLDTLYGLRVHVSPFQPCEQVLVSGTP